MFKLSKIKSIKPLGKMIVADITVENDSSYIGNGVVNHNSSRSPNLQNLPSDEAYRKCFITALGNKFLNCDFASQEGRLAAEVSGDQKMLDFFNLGHPIFKDDIHSFVGTMMFSLIRNDPNLIILKKTHPEERQIAKVTGFKTIYGGSAFTMKDDFGVTVEEAQTFIDGYLDAFPGLKEYFNKCEEAVMKTGEIVIDEITGRKWFSPDFHRLADMNKEIWSYFPKNYRQLSQAKRTEAKEKVYKEFPHVKEMWSFYFTIQGSLKRTSYNYPVQGRAGSQTKKAAVLFREYCIENNLTEILYLVNLIHDECSAECEESFAEEGLRILKTTMIDGAQYFCKKVKMDASGNISNNWEK